MARNHGTMIAPVAQELALGIAAGMVLEPIVLETVSHEYLAHRSVDVHPALETVGRTIANVMGVSPNRGAARHREHHYKGEVEHLDMIAAARSIFSVAGGSSDLSNAAREHLEIRGLDIATDPLIEELPSGRLAFRHDPPLERFVASSRLKRLMPFAGFVAGMAVVNKLRHKNHPVARAAAFSGGVLLGTAQREVHIAFAEQRAGMHDSQIGRTNPLHRRTVGLHQLHHDRPWQPEAGLGVRNRLALSALQHLGLVKAAA